MCHSLKTCSVFLTLVSTCTIRLPSSSLISPFRKRSMPCIGNQAFQNGRCHIRFNLGLDKVETGYNLLMELNALIKCLIVYIHTGLPAVSFYLMFGATLS